MSCICRFDGTAKLYTVSIEEQSIVPNRGQEENCERRDSWVSARYKLWGMLKACSHLVQMEIRKRGARPLGGPIGEGGMGKWAA